MRRMKRKKSPKRGLPTSYREKMLDVLNRIPKGKPAEEIMDIAISELLNHVIEEDGQVKRKRGQLVVKITNYARAVRHAIPHRQSEIEKYYQSALDKPHERIHVDKIKEIAEEEGVHEDLSMDYNRYQLAFEEYMKARKLAERTAEDVVKRYKRDIREIVNRIAPSEGKKEEIEEKMEDTEKAMEEEIGETPSRPVEVKEDEELLPLIEKIRNGNLTSLERKELIQIANNVQLLPEDVLLEVFENIRHFGTKKVFVRSDNLSES